LNEKTTPIHLSVGYMGVFSIEPSVVFEQRDGLQEAKMVEVLFNSLNVDEFSLSPAGLTKNYRRDRHRNDGKQ
jgi:hypothetical protein